MADGSGQIIPQGFDEYVSLGYNCEVAFQLRRALGYDRSQFFNWCIAEIDTVTKLIEARFSGILEPENVEFHQPGSMFYDRAYGYWFKSNFIRDVTEHALSEEARAANRGRGLYLAKKFLKPVGRRCYFYKAQKSVTDEQAQRLWRALGMLGSPFQLVILRQKSSARRPIKAGAVNDRVLARLAPIHDATDAHTLSWDRVFSEFSHVEGIRTAYY